MLSRELPKSEGTVVLAGDFLLIPLSKDHCVVLRRPTKLFHFESRDLTQALNTTVPLYLWTATSISIVEMFCYYRISLSLHSLKKIPFSSDFLPDPVVISFSCPVCCRALISCSVSSFSFSLRAAALCQNGLSLVFHFPICLLSAIGPPLTCGSLFPCSPCVFFVWVWLYYSQIWPG